MSRFVVFGCSLAYGVGLPDCWPDVTKSSKFCWPEIVAKELGRTCINKSVPGSSNKRIWFAVNRFKFKPDDLVFVLWSYNDRTALITTPYTITNLAPGITLGKPGELSKIYYENFHSFYDAEITTKLYIRDTTNRLKNLGVSFYQTCAQQSCKEYFEETPHVPIYMEYYEKNFNKGLDNDHAGLEGHQAFAKDFLDYMKVETDIKRPVPLSFFEKIKRKCR